MRRQFEYTPVLIGSCTVTRNTPPDLADILHDAMMVHSKMEQIIEWLPHSRSELQVVQNKAVPALGEIAQPKITVLEA
jgi:hypothetical protein